MTTKAQLLKAVRAKCLDCCCYQVAEVKACTATRCELWPYRMGRDPNPSGRGFAKNPTASREVFGSGDTKAVDHAPKALATGLTSGTLEGRTAMREYSKVSPNVWQSERFNSLPSDDGRLPLPISADLLASEQRRRLSPSRWLRLR